MAHSISGYGDKLVTAVKESPARLPLLQTVHLAAQSGIEFSIGQSELRQLIEISSRYPSARQAQQSGIAGIQSRLTEAFATRIRHATKHDFKPRMLATLTIMVVDLSLMLWFHGEFKDSASTSKHVLGQLAKLLSEDLV